MMQVLYFSVNVTMVCNLLYLQSSDIEAETYHARELMGTGGSLAASDGAELTDIGREFYPEGLTHVI